MKKAAHLIVALVLLGAGALLARWYDAHFAGTESEAPRKPLYYRNPMGLPDTSPVPKKDSMGMDYIPVYAEDVAAAPAREMKGDVGTGNILRIPLEKVQKIGVRTEPAALREIKADITAVGVIEADERSRVTIAPRFEGWIEKLHVNETGRAVHRGEPLFSAYSPELVAAQQEYLIALGAAQRGAGQLGDELLQTARTRLLNWQLSEGDIRTLESRREPMRTVTFRAPADGVVLEKTAETGMRFMPGEVLYRLADLHNVWLMASVYEQDIGDVRIGLPVNLQIDSFPSELFHGRVGFIYPTLDDATRTAKVRIELGNEDLRLRPGMYGRVTVQVLRHGGQVLSVPDSAVLDSGVRQLVLVERGEGMFEPRDVVIGVRGSGYVEIREGLADRERVVVSANFLIDAESNLRAAIDSFGHADHGSKPAGTGAAPVHEHGAPVEAAEHGGH
jgi:Cu(I)/Ag(I) efflux system membrane fusion protein